LTALLRECWGCSDHERHACRQQAPAKSVHGILLLLRSVH
jgi:hypothetical protein